MTAPLNTRPIADAGAALLTASTGALGTLIVHGATCGARLLIAPVALCFLGIAVGGALSYLGRPVTVRA